MKLRKVLGGLIGLLIIQLSFTQLVFAIDSKSEAYLSLYVFEGNTPINDFFVWVDKETKLSTNKIDSNKSAAANFTMSEGEHQLSVAREGFENAVINLDVKTGEYIQIIVTLYPESINPHVSIESSSDNEFKVKQVSSTPLGEPGVIKGKVSNSETGEPVSGARLFFSGVETDFVTDKNGEFEANIPSSTYSLSILHNRFASQTLDGIEIKPGMTLEKQFEVTPAGIALKEFVVVAPFIQGSVSSLVDERKETKVVSDFVGAEQMSKSGDSDAAAALTRVAGLTLIDGKYAVIRGMEDRYTTVLMNGAMMRSPDPNSKSVDLDMFPASILDSIEVQKTYSADSPGAFGGGLIKLRTKALPEEDFVKFKISTGGNTNTTGKNILSQQSGSQDYLGIDDGGRDIPSLVPSGQYNAQNDYQFLTDAEQEAVAESFAVRYQTKQERAEPNLGLALSFGQLFNFSGMKTGYQAYLGYGNKWSNEEGESNTYAANGSTLTQRNDQEYQKSKYSVDVTALFNGAIENDHTKIKSTTALIRKSYRLTRKDEGIDGENTETLEKYNLEWSERELFSQQFNGMHELFSNVTANWQYGISNASLNNPDRIAYRYDNNETGTDELYFRDGNTSREFIELEDNSQTMGFDLLARFKPASFLDLDVKIGYSFDSTERESQLTRFEYKWFDVGDEPVSIIEQQNPNDVLSEDNIGPNGFLLSNNTRLSDGYDANRETTGLYTQLNTTWFQDFDLIIGMRSETFTQELNTFDSLVNTPINVNQETDNRLPSLLATYRIMSGMQIRFALAETVNRPSMLELSSSTWIDPESGDLSVGNPRLVEATINHFDARLEFYGSGANSLSFAYFSKDFSNPIERTIAITSGSDESVTYQNAQSANSSGVEIDFRYDLRETYFAGLGFGVSGNYSLIDSEVVLPSNTTEFSTSRTMQGQSPYTMNLMLTVDHDALGIETALVFNEIGERITKVGQGDVPHVYEEPFSALDFTLSSELSEGKLSFKLKNILDSERLYTQGGKVYKRSEPGVGFSLAYGLSF